MNTQQLTHFVQAGRKSFWANALEALEHHMMIAAQNAEKYPGRSAHHMGAWERHLVQLPKHDS